MKPRACAWPRDIVAIIAYVDVCGGRLHLQFKEISIPLEVVACLSAYDIFLRKYCATVCPPIAWTSPFVRAQPLNSCGHESIADRDTCVYMECVSHNEVPAEDHSIL